MGWGWTELLRIHGYNKEKALQQGQAVSARCEQWWPEELSQVCVSHPQNPPSVLCSGSNWKK